MPMPAMDTRERKTRVIGRSPIACNFAGRLSTKGGLRLGRMSDSLRFPDGFLFGAATSAYQTEGGNVNSDWWWWEHVASTPTEEPSGDACDFYHRYRDDVAMLAA